jgi:hypothetical protein
MCPGAEINLMRECYSAEYARDSDSEERVNDCAGFVNSLRSLHAGLELAAVLAVDSHSC